MTQQKLSAAQAMQQARPTGAVERQVTSIPDVLWTLGVLNDGGQDRALVALCASPQELSGYRDRLTRSKVKAVRADNWQRLNLDPCTVTVYVRGGCMSELSAEYRENLPGGFRNRRSRFLANPPQEVTPRWMDAALARRPVLALVPADVFDVAPEDWNGYQLGADQLLAGMVTAASERRLWAGLMDADLGVEP